VGYIFEWDAGKAASNARKHGIMFEEASTVFGDPLALVMPDPDHSEDEERHLLLGISNRRRLVVVAFAERGSRTRLISARRARRLTLRIAVTTATPCGRNMIFPKLYGASRPHDMPKAPTSP
jgi:uncharacterized DUF497 family protein